MNQQEIAESFYDLEYFISLEYRYFSGAHQSRINHIMRAIGDVSNKCCLDVGCGGGYFTNEIHKQGGNVVGLDYAEAAIQFGRTRYPHLDLRVQSGLDLQNMEKQSYDLISLIDVIEHVHNQYELINLLTQLLKSGGRLVISTDAEDTVWFRSPFKRIFPALERFSKDGQAMRLIRQVEQYRKTTKNYHKSHIACLTTTELKGLVESAGLHVMSQIVFPVVGVPLRDVFLRLLPQKFHGDHQVLVAQKR